MEQCVGESYIVPGPVCVSSQALQAPITAVM
ncbi:hypothetical protein SUNI508_05087 [Seiridium unicorne]|uniref:Uncharacterized protein n=1 Tax=Seiridium unicorne TaxID=138068 RepID=A0ABR2V5K0_9PEZI